MINKVGIIHNPGIPAAVSLVPEIVKLLASRGVEVWNTPAGEVAAARANTSGTGLILSVGGDGTILRAAQVVAGGDIPICGVNLGKLGFMTELAVDEVPQTLPRLLDGEGWLDQRAMLSAKVSSENGTDNETYLALNDVVVSRGQVPRMINVAAAINGERLTDYRADGVIVATATGSTGYAMAAGGPVLSPVVKDLLLLPLSPHLSPAYALVLPETATFDQRRPPGDAVG